MLVLQSVLKKRALAKKNKKTFHNLSLVSRFFFLTTRMCPTYSAPTHCLHCTTNEKKHIQNEYLWIYFIFLSAIIYRAFVMYTEQRAICVCNHMYGIFFLKWKEVLS